MSLTKNPTPRMVEYKSQKIKSALIDKSQTPFGTLPVVVVVLGGEAPAFIPIILGLVE